MIDHPQHKNRSQERSQTRNSNYGMTSKFDQTLQQKGIQIIINKAPQREIQVKPKVTVTNITKIKAYPVSQNNHIFAG
jgi:hypothetical protein